MKVKLVKEFQSSFERKLEEQLNAIDKVGTIHQIQYQLGIIEQDTPLMTATIIYSESKFKKFINCIFNRLRVK